MRVTKFTHSCLRVEGGGAVLVVDPGAFSERSALDGADAVLITHEHFDHLDPDRVRRAQAEDPSLQIFANKAVAEQLSDLKIKVIGHEDAFSVAGFDIQVYGDLHALIHADIPQVVNTGFLVEGEVFHPGDSFTVPGQRRSLAERARIDDEHGAVLLDA